MPLLSDWRAEVLKQPDPEASEIALAAELITEGSLNVFAHPTNVDINNRIVVLDLYEMGEQLRPTALVVALEAIQNRVMENRKRGKIYGCSLTKCICTSSTSILARFCIARGKDSRKYGAALTAASQNVEECLKSETARLMFANSEFLLLFNQAATDRAEDCLSCFTFPIHSSATLQTPKPVTACCAWAAPSCLSSIPFRGILSCIN